MGGTYWQFWDSYADDLEELTDEETGKLVKAVMHYRQTGEVVTFRDRALNMEFRRWIAESDRAMQHRQEVSEARSTAGKMGGRPRKAPADQITNAFDENQKNQMLFEESKKSKKSKKSQSECERDSERESERESESEGKHTHGKFQNVNLTDDEYLRLKSAFPWIDRTIEELSAKLAEGTAKSENHYATLTRWAKVSNDKTIPEDVKHILTEEEITANRRAAGIED